MNKDKIVLKIEKLSKRFPGVQALQSIDFDLKRGEVHVLLGENGAGKSTLVKILSGSLLQDSGTIFLDGEKVNFFSPEEAQNRGIAMVYQELDLIPSISIAENIFLGRYPLKKLFGIIDWRQVYHEAEKIFKENFNLEIDVRREVKRFGVAIQQLTAIARALSQNPKVLILDEPTSALSPLECQQLFKIIRNLKKRGVSIIFISHRLKETFEIGDRVTILRNGEKVNTLLVKDVSEQDLVRMMLGREADKETVREKTSVGDEILRVKDLTKEGMFYKCNLRLYQGEILGITGLMGAGRTEFAKSLFGVLNPDKGEVYIQGRRVKIRSPKDAIRAGIGYLNENRMEGLVPFLSIAGNITLASLNYICKMGLLMKDKEKSISKRFVDELEIHPPELEREVRYFSGGNQQKVALSRWLCNRSKILILDEPTRGIDVGAKEEVFRLMSRLSKEGISIIMISSEMPEVLRMADRILVMHKGRFVAEYKRGEATQEDLLLAAAGGEKNARI
ncbi:sugar ABC transporter ATP-binding protein [Candidatus Aerophobetes bacterium]|nr:sugar ABC transporter ATP-binding protein [Candidatus Aerophobetes bacterium]